MNSISAGITSIALAFTASLVNGHDTENGGSGNACMCEYCVDGMEDGKGECVCVSNEYVWQNEEKNCVKKSNLSNLDAGEVVGIVIGCVVAVFLLVLAFYCFYVKPDESASHYGVDSQLRRYPLESSISATCDHSAKDELAYENVFEDDEADKITTF